MQSLHKRIALLTLAALAGIAAQARQLTPDEALAAATGAPESQAMRMPARQMRLAATLTRDGINTVYAFNRDGADAGFVLVAADDVARPVLGYSATGSFSTDGMPANLAAWLDSYSAQIAAAVASGCRVEAAAPRVGRADVAPMITTRWNQDAPYNNQAPMLNGHRSVTGCVATAAAQVLNYYRWPDCGTGTASYTWETGGKKLSYDFTAHPFDWDNMLDTYTASSGTAAQRDAVATLMYACGMASSMDYSPTASGAADYDLAVGLVDYLKYDKSLLWARRDYFPLDEWVGMIYDEIATGHPLIYCGATASNEGHCFVIDGYSAADGYFHLNWGWGGISDGYFAITTLSPDVQGIGGADAGFAYQQSALLGLRKSAGTATYTPMFVMEGPLTPVKTTVNRSDYFCRFSSGGMVYSCSLGTVSVMIGLKLTSTTSEQVRYVWTYGIGYQAFGPFIGYNDFSDHLYFQADDFPSSGVWRVTPVVQADSKVYPIHAPAGSSQYITVTCTSSKLTFETQKTDYALVCDGLDLAPAYKAGEEVSIKARVSNTGNTETGLKQIVLGFFYGASGNTAVGTVDNIGAGSESTLIFTGKLATGIPDGEYPLLMQYQDAQGKTVNVDLHGATIRIGAYDGIDEASGAQAAAVVVPNPVDDIATLSAGSAIDRVEIYTLSGTQALTASGDGAASLRLDLGGLAPGVYIARVATAAGVQSIKIIKK